MGQTADELYQQELKEAKPVITLQDEKMTSEISEEKVDENESNSKDQLACRFCWSDESTEENPCIVPCKCKGSVGFVHFECLRNWLSTKLQRKETENLVSMYWKTFECEICK